VREGEDELLDVGKAGATNEPRSARTKWESSKKVLGESCFVFNEEKSWKQTDEKERKGVKWT
jgi:hypothetical protein